MLFQNLKVKKSQAWGNSFQIKREKEASQLISMGGPGSDADPGEK